MLLTRSCSGPRSQCIGLQGRTQPRLRCFAVSSAATEVAPTEFEWKGSDEFSALEDRKDLPPLPLPAIKTRRRVVLVRHGQSTWNAEGRIQGSSNFSCLTPKGIAQAETTRDMASAVSSVTTLKTLYQLMNQPIYRAAVLLCMPTCCAVTVSLQQQQTCALSAPACRRIIMRYQPAVYRQHCLGYYRHQPLQPQA
jgi:hypothetical protein